MKTLWEVLVPVPREGRIEQDGSAAELLEVDGYFRGMMASGNAVLA